MTRTSVVENQRIDQRPSDGSGQPKNRKPNLMRACLAIMLGGVIGVGSALMPSAGVRAETLTPQAAAAKERALKLMARQGSWNGPTSAPKPVAGKRIAVIPVTLAGEGAARPSRAIAEAGHLIGWKVDILDGRGDPMEQNKALNAAVDANYDGIVLIYVDTPVVSDGVTRVLAKHIPLITMGGLNNMPPTLPDVSHDFVGHGRAIADYMIWKSNGAVNALLLKNTDIFVAEFGQFKGSYETLTDKTLCPDCKIEVRDWTIANIDTQPADITVAAVQANPAMNWVWCFDTCMTRVVRRLDASGIAGSQLQAAGFDCDGENLSFIKEGNIQTVSACDPRDWEAYAVVDNMNRLLHGEPTVDQHIPIKMFAKENIADLGPEESKIGWQGDYDFRTQFRKLWGVQ
jgi:ribose transport system substrate-binding protein